MAFLSKFFSRAERAPLLSLEEMLQAKGLSPELPGLAALAPEFEHLDAEDREAWVQAVADLQARGLPLPPVWSEAQYELLPQLVPAWMAEREAYFFRPFMEGLSQRVLVGNQVMPAAWLTLWDVAEGDVLERSLDHLREKSKGKPFQRLSSGIYQSTYGDGMDASRLLLPEFWGDLFPGQNTFVAIPTQDVMLVSPQVLLPKLLDAIGKLQIPEDRRLVSVILQRIEHRILVANLQDPHPIAQPQRELRQGDLLHAYRVQDRDLDPALGATCEMGILRTQQGKAISYALWVEGGPVQLPDADLVGFVSAKGEPLGLCARQTLPRIGELRGVPVDIWGPRRIRYDGFPTKEQIDRLECFATGAQMAGIFKAPAAAPRPAAPSAPQSPLLSLGASPVPAHLRGQTLGVQDEK